jgi:hypothetical protein
MVHPEPGQRPVGQRPADLAPRLDQSEIRHPAQQAPRDPRRAPRPAGNLAATLRLGLHPHQPRPPRDDLVQLRLGIELQPGRNAEPVAQRRRQQPQPRRRPDQREGLQVDPHRPRRRPLADHQIQREILQRRIQHLLDHRRQPVNLVDEQHIARFQIGQDRRQIARLRQHRPRGHAEPHPQLPRHDLRQRGLAQTRRPVEQRVIHRLAPHPGALDEHRQIGPRLRLADELAQHLRPQGAVGVFGQFGASSFRAARISAAVSASARSPATVATACAASPCP